jgi:hypothetical protein
MRAKFLGILTATVIVFAGLAAPNLSNSASAATSYTVTEVLTLLLITVMYYPDSIPASLLRPISRLPQFHTGNFRYVSVYRLVTRTI